MSPEIFLVIIDHFKRGGNIMLPLLLISVVMWVLIILKILELFGLKKEALLEDCLNSMENKNIEGAFWQKEIVQRYFQLKTHSLDIDTRLIQNIVFSQQRRTRFLLNTILVLAAMAPLLGLLGTILGMITTFDTIGRFGTGNSKALAAGISEALITTQTGLIISIPGLYMGHFLKRRFENLEERIKKFGLGFCMMMNSENSQKLMWVKNW